MTKNDALYTKSGTGTTSRRSSSRKALARFHCVAAFYLAVFGSAAVLYDLMADTR
jgi:hypothetical protein